MRVLKLETIAGVVELNDIIEYAFGFKYLFVRVENNTLSIDRSTIQNAYRKYKDKWIKINMKTPKKKEQNND